MVIDSTFKIKLNHLFFIVFILISLFVFIALFNQYRFSKKILIQNYVNKELLFTSKIKERLKNILDIIQFTFRSNEDECIKKTEILQLLYKNGKFNATKVAEILNKNYNGPGHFEVFVINKNYIVSQASYKPDLGFNLGKFDVYRKILQSVFDGKKKIDISYPHVDYSSMNIKKYYLVRSPDGKVLLQLAFVVDIYSRLKKEVTKLLAEIPELKKINIYFVEKYMIYKINFNHREYKKLPVLLLIKNSNNILNTLIKDMKIKTPLLKTGEQKNISSLIDDIFNKKGRFYIFDNNEFKVLSLIRGIFHNATDKLLLETIFTTTMLQKNLNDLKNRFLIILGILIFLFFVIYKFLVLKVSRDINEVILHMKQNSIIKKDSSYIKEIEELKKYFNKFRDDINAEIEKNRLLLSQNKRFIVDTIHQIKTPLSVITLNIDFIKEKYNDSEIKEILEEIEAAVAILRNSYDDLSYISANGIVRYEAKEDMNMSTFLKERISFFEVVARANHKQIISDIEDDLFFKINHIELERIIDNNLSNAIKYSNENKIYVSLKKRDNKCILKFESYSQRIKNPQNVFNKNYREHSHKRGLGIGLNIVKEICEKYKIKYSVYYQDGKNIFEYQFKC